MPIAAKKIRVEVPAGRLWDLLWLRRAHVEGQRRPGPVTSFGTAREGISFLGPGTGLAGKRKHIGVLPGDGQAAGQVIVAEVHFLQVGQLAQFRGQGRKMVKAQVQGLQDCQIAQKSQQSRQLVGTQIQGLQSSQLAQDGGSAAS